MSFSVIIATYNEEKIIRNQIRIVRGLLDAEIIVVDGGSTDDTQAIVEEEDVMLIPSRKGRGTQFAIGAENASKNYLVFLHADTRLPIQTSAKLSRFFQDENRKIGAFTIKFEPSNPFLDLITIASGFDSILTTFGDQCIFLRKNFYEEIKGFPDWPLFEDVYLLQKARKLTRVYKINGPVVSSSRRFLKRGMFRQLILNTCLLILYLLGVHPKTLVRFY